MIFKRQIFQLVLIVVFLSLGLQQVWAQAPTINYGWFSTQDFTITGVIPISGVMALQPTVTNSPTSYSVNPSLPSGLSFSTSTGYLTGKPTTYSTEATSYTITATNSSGSGTTTLKFNPGIPSSISSMSLVVSNSIDWSSTFSSNGSKTQLSIISPSIMIPSFYSANVPYTSLSASINLGSITTDRSMNLVTVSLNGGSDFNIFENNKFYSVPMKLQVGLNTIVLKTYNGIPEVYGETYTFKITRAAVPNLSITYPESQSYFIGNGIETISPTITGATPGPSVVNTFAGQITSGSANGIGIAATFCKPSGSVTDTNGNLYVTDACNNLIRKIVIATGEVTTLAGSGTAKLEDGTGTNASFYNPQGIAYDGSDNLYVTDTGNNSIRKIVISTGVVNTVAGSAIEGFTNATGMAATFSKPIGIAFNSNILYVTDTGNNSIRKILIPSGVVSTLAGSSTSGLVNASSTAVRFYQPMGIAYYSNYLYVADAGNNCIRKVSISSATTTLAGTLASGSTDGVGNSFAGNANVSNFSGSTVATFNNPNGVAVDPTGTYLYVAETGNNLIRQVLINQLGYTSTLAGGGTGIATNGYTTSATFDSPGGLATDAAGNLYVSDSANNIIRKLTSYSITPALPEGLSFNSNTGSITGTPISLKTATTYSIRTGNYFLSSTATNLSIAVLSNDIIWTGTNSTTWSDAGNWSTNRVPIATSDVTITSVANQPQIASSVAIHSLTIDSGASLTVPTGRNLTVANYIHNSGTLTIENNANLIQVDQVANTGNAIVKRNSFALLRSDYTLWSSPVASQNLLAFSPLTVATRFYDYKSDYGTYGAYSAVTSPSTTTFEVGKGYLIRMPNNTNAITPTSYWGIYTGFLNNGNVPVTLNYYNANQSCNLVGNPYPSVVDATTFINANTADIESTLYFWRKTNRALGSAYATYNPAGGVASATSEVPNGKIQVGQGFFVQAKSAGLKTSFFTNAMRDLSPISTQFYKTKQVIEKNRIWVNLTTIGGVFSQALIAYITDASLGIDTYDGKYINDSPIALTSNINNEEYTIQGRPAFDPSDVVALNFKTDLMGDYTIALDHSDGIFELGQDVYLVDSKTGIETNLKTDAYTFVAATGTDNTRFSLKYQKTLKVDAPVFNENNVLVCQSNGILYIQSTVNAIDGIKVFDLHGRLIAEQKSVNAHTATIKNMRTNDQILIVQVTSNENKVINKKVIHKIL